MKKFLISLIGLLLVPSMAFALSGYQSDQSVNVTAGSQIVVVGSGVYLGCEFMVTSADDQVAIVDASSLTTYTAIGNDRVLLDKRTPTAKGEISDLAPAGGIPFNDGLCVHLTDNGVDGVVRFKLNP